MGSRGKTVRLEASLRLDGASIPGGLPDQGKSGNKEIRHVAMDDPYRKMGEMGKPQRVALNANYDVLEREFVAQRLSAADHAAARTLQRSLEMVAETISGGGQWAEGDRGDVTLRADHRMVKLIDNAATANALNADVERVIGAFGMAVMKRALLRRESFHSISKILYGSAEAREVFHVAQTFRDSCMAIADHWAAVGERVDRSGVKLRWRVDRTGKTTVRAEHERPRVVPRRPRGQSGT